MTQRLLTIHNTPKTALVLITLFLLLMPHKAGAENYNIWIGDTQITTENQSDVLGDGKIAFTVTVSLDGTGGNAYILTLNEVNLSQSITCNLYNLIIDVQGKNIITKEGAPAITSTLSDSAPAITITSTNSPIGSLTLRNTSNENNCGGVINSGIRVSTSKDSSIELLSPAESFLTMDTTHVATFGEDYHLRIGTTELTNINISDITSDGRINYNQHKRTLTLTNATINGGIEWSLNNGENSLTISLDGDNIITNTNGAAITATGMEQNPILTFTKADNADNCKLTLETESNSNGTIIGFDYEQVFSSNDFFILRDNDGNKLSTTITSSIFSGGHGTKDEPFIISSKEDLRDFSYYMNTRDAINPTINRSFFMLSNDIECSGLTEYEPIDGDDSPFNGTFDGNDKTISNLMYSTSDLREVGLFKSIRNEGTVKKLTLRDCTFTGGHTVGAITGYLEGTIENCSIINCTISSGNAQTSKAGGLVGEIYGGRVEGCSTNNSTIKAEPNWDTPEAVSGNNGSAIAGGIAGSLSGGLITSCEVDNSNIFSSHPNANNELGAAGIIGYCNDSESTVSDNSVKGTTMIHSSSSSATSANAACAGAIGGAINNNPRFSNNTYEFSITVENKNYNDSEPIIKSGYEKRGLGRPINDQYDIYENNGALLANIHKVTLPTNLTGGEIWLRDSYDINISNETVQHIVEGQEAVVGIQPSTYYAVKTFSATDTKTESTISTRVDNEIIGDDILAYVFTMPNADVTIDASFGIDLANQDHFPQASTADSTYTGTAQIPSCISLTEVNLETSETTTTTLTDTDFTIIDYKQGDISVESTVDAGEYIVTIKGIGDYTGIRDVNYTINKAAIQSTQITAPTAKDDLVYTGEDQQLISPGIVPNGATMLYSLKTETPNDKWSSAIPTGKDAGTYEVLYKVDGGSNYENIEAATQPITVTIAVAAMTVTATGYTGTYDAQPHGISVTAPEGATVKYGTEKGTYELSASPTFTDAGSYMVHYQITQENYITIADSAKVEIAKADITPTVALEGWIFGTTPNEPQVEGNTGGGAVSYTYQAAGSETFTTEIPTAIGTHTVKATIAATTNYNAAEATATFTIAVAAMTVTATGYTGIYDAQPHGISVTAPEGATVKYGTEKGTYELSASPTFTDAGSYMVHYQITQENYITIADSAKVEIAKADITPTVSLEGWIFGTTPNEPQVEGNTGGGAVSYTYQAAGSETFSTEIPTAIGTHTVKASIAATTNYNAAEATAQFTIAVAAMTVTATGYTDTYDAQPHGISVTAPEGATVKYGTEKGTYELSASPTYTDAGSYMVHYQITQENYITIADSAKVEIAKADITPTVSLEGWIFGTTPNEPQVEGNTGGGAVSYTYQAAGSETFSTEIPTAIGTHTVKATIAETTNYNAAEATAQFTIDGGYLLWIGGTLVTDANKTDILGDAGNNEQSIPSFTFNPDNNCLVIINSTEGLVIESQRPLLKIHLNGTNTLRRISFNNGGNNQNTGQLLFTCESSNPGSVTIENTEAESCISGFESVAYEFNLCVLDPEGTNYKDGKIVNTDGTPASKVSISVPLTPMTGEEPERLNPEEFTTTNDEGETVAKSMDNTVAGNVLYTINEQVDGQGYDQETNSIVVIQTMTDDEVQKIVEAAKNNTVTVGTDEYAEQYNGLTFVVPGGTGVIKIVQETAAGYEFRLKIGDDESLTLGEGKGGLLSSEFPYDLEDATYCWLYLAQSRAATRRAAWERVGKRNKGLGNIQTVKVSPSKMASSNSASTASGGVITQTISEVTTGVVEADAGTSKTAEATSQRWYTIDGRRIDQPTKKGIYIRNNKKVVIK